MQVGTYEYALKHGGIFVTYVGKLSSEKLYLLFLALFFKLIRFVFASFSGAFIAALFFFGRSIHFCTMKVSVVDGTA